MAAVLEEGAAWTGWVISLLDVVEPRLLWYPVGAEVGVCDQAGSVPGSAVCSKAGFRSYLFPDSLEGGPYAFWCKDVGDEWISRR